MFSALRAFIAGQPRAAQWTEFDIINTAFWQIDQLLSAAGGQWNDDVALGVAAINRWMLAELKRLRDDS